MRTNNDSVTTTNATSNPWKQHKPLLLTTKSAAKVTLSVSHNDQLFTNLNQKCNLTTDEEHEEEEETVNKVIYDVEQAQQQHQQDKQRLIEKPITQSEISKIMSSSLSLLSRPVVALAVVTNESCCLSSDCNILLSASKRSVNCIGMIPIVNSHGVFLNESNTDGHDVGDLKTTTSLNNTSCCCCCKRLFHLSTTKPIITGQAATLANQLAATRNRHLQAFHHTTIKSHYSDSLRYSDDFVTTCKQTDTPINNNHVSVQDFVCLECSLTWKYTNDMLITSMLKVKDTEIMSINYLHEAAHREQDDQKQPQKLMKTTSTNLVNRSNLKFNNYSNNISINQDQKLTHLAHMNYNNSSEPASSCQAKDNISLYSHDNYNSAIHKAEVMQHGLLRNDENDLLAAQAQECEQSQSNDSREYINPDTCMLTINRIEYQQKQEKSPRRMSNEMNEEEKFLQDDNDDNYDDHLLLIDESVTSSSEFRHSQQEAKLGNVVNRIDSILTRSRKNIISSKQHNTQLQLLQFIIYTLITSSILLLTITPPQNVLVKCTNYYWPLRRLNQHHLQQQQQHNHLVHPVGHHHHQHQHLDGPTSGHSVDSSMGIDSVTAATQIRPSLLVAGAVGTSGGIAKQQSTNSSTNNKQPLKRHQLLIGQHYSNFSSDIPYSLIQDTDYGSMIDVAAGQVMDVVDSDPYDQQLTQHQLQQQQQQQAHETSLDNHHQQLQTTNAYRQSQQANNQQHQQHQLVDGFPVGIPLDHNHQHNQESPLLVDMTKAAAGDYFGQQQQPMSSSSSLFVVGGGGGNGGVQQIPSDINGGVSSASLRKNDDELHNSNSRALLPFSSDSNRLMMPQMQQIKARFNQGCVGGTKCQFFAFCWMSGGSLGASCGLLMTCCVTPSRHEIQPGFYGPVVNDQHCGRSTSKINRIVGGTDASFGQFPWQAFVQVGGSRCGGALISSRHVVTAGHCVARSQHSPSSIKVTLGDYILNSDIESIPHEVFSVVEVFLHPNFRFTPQADRYDVAVLELDRQASYKDNIKPICLPQKDAIFVGRVAYVAGWGALQAGSKLRPKVLQHVAVPVIENQVCESWHRRKGIDIRIYDEMMCAGYELGQRDACQGDSGGPLMLNQFGVWYLVGIVSAGYSCAKQYQPGIYHRVSSSSDWISSNIYQQGSNK